MRYFLIFILTIVAFTGFGQIQKGTGVLYFNDRVSVQAYVPNESYGSELAMSLDSSILFRYDRLSGSWEEVDNTIYDNSNSGLSATNLQNAIDETIELIPGGISGGNIVYVSKSTGNNLIAKQGNYLFPFKEPWTARDSAIAWNVDYVYILDGEFTYDWDFNYGHDFFANSDIERLSLCRNLTYVANAGVSFINYGSTDALFYDEWGYDCKFLGDAKFTVTNKGLVRLFNKNARLDLRGSEILNNGVSLYLIATKDEGDGFFSNINIKFDKITSNGFFKFFGFWHRWGESDTLSNANVNLQIENMYIEDSWILNMEPIKFIDCDFSVQIKNLVCDLQYNENSNNSRSLLYTYNSLINTNVTFQIDNYRTINNGGNENSFFTSRDHADAVPNSNSKILFNIRSGIGNTKLCPPGNIFSAYKTGGSNNEFNINGIYSYTGNSDWARLKGSVFKFNFQGDLDSSVKLFSIESDDVDVEMRGRFSILSNAPVINYTAGSQSTGKIQLENSYFKNTSGVLINALTNVDIISCNTNLVQDSVGVNVNLIFCNNQNNSTIYTDTSLLGDGTQANLLRINTSLIPDTNLGNTDQTLTGDREIDMNGHTIGIANGNYIWEFNHLNNAINENVNGHIFNTDFLDLKRKNGGTFNANLRFFENPINGINYISLKAPDDISQSISYTLPSAGNEGELLVLGSFNQLQWESREDTNLGNSNLVNTQGTSASFDLNGESLYFTEDSNFYFGINGFARQIDFRADALGFRTNYIKLTRQQGGLENTQLRFFGDPSVSVNSVNIQAPDTISSTYNLILPGEQRSGVLESDSNGNTRFGHIYSTSEKSTGDKSVDGEDIFEITIKKDQPADFIATTTYTLHQGIKMLYDFKGYIEFAGGEIRRVDLLNKNTFTAGGSCEAIVSANDLKWRYISTGFTNNPIKMYITIRYTKL